MVVDYLLWRMRWSLSLAPDPGMVPDARVFGYAAEEPIHEVEAAIATLTPPAASPALVPEWLAPLGGALPEESAGAAEGPAAC